MASTHLDEKSSNPPSFSLNSQLHSPATAGPCPRSPHVHHHPRYSHPHSHPVTVSSLRLESRWRSWLPIILYALTSLGFLVAIACYRDELFSGLDQLSHYLRHVHTDDEDGYWGYLTDGRVILGGLIFLTTIPPIPLYSTLIVLSGYTFDWFTGAVISYVAALAGALVVFLVSRLFLHSCIQSWLHSTTTLKRVVIAIERRPKLLFLIRLAPYPYNVMNCLLAASRVDLRTYTVCTALSLFKVVIHTSVGASIHSFRSHYTNGGEDDEVNWVARTWTIGGIMLCVAILAYLSVVARRAVDEELYDDDEDRDQRVVFLADESDVEAMAESPFSRRPSSGARSPMR